MCSAQCLFLSKFFLMKTNFFFLLLIVALLSACQNEESQDARYLIAKNKIGKLTKDTQVKELDSVFKNDSVVNKNTSARFSDRNEIVVYKKNGQELLRLQLVKKFDSTSTIGSVEVLDTIFKTKKGLGKGSAFETLKANYKISRIENTLGAALVFIDEINAYVNIDKKDILKPVKAGTPIKPSQIKNKAKIKHFWLGWE